MPLTPSQRVRYLTEISRRLSTEGWPVIDLTLRQFGFPTEDEWRGGPDAYVLNMLEFGLDADIEPTREWQSEIELALATCDSLLALLTPEYHASKSTDQEVGYAMGREVLVFSIRLGQDVVQMQLNSPRSPSRSFWQTRSRRQECARP